MNKRKQFIGVVLFSTLFMILGVLALHYQQIAYGYTIFALLPFAIGYIAGSYRIRIISALGIIFSLLIFLALLYAGALEGMVCILMSFPIIAFFMLLGFIFYQLYRVVKKGPHKKNELRESAFALLLLFCVGHGEAVFYIERITGIEVATEVRLDYSAEEVYDAIKSVDTLIAELPFLMQLDLPIPHKCVLEKEEVGALRTCYFEGGNIVEKVTELKPAEVLKMDVLEYQLVGRKWLGFEEAIYYFEAISDTTSKMTRVTVYNSVLYPRIYWEPLERIGVEQEHDFVIANLKLDLARNRRNNK